MNIKEIQFKESASQRIYKNYIDRIEKCVSTLSKADQREVLLEYNSHIYEGLGRNHNGTETDRLLDILEKLGEPEQYLKPLIADKKLEQATRTFNPVHLFKALALNITNGISYLIFGLLYIALLGFVFLIYAKLSNPRNVGLFLKNDSFLALGKLNDGYLKNPEISEGLGNWFVPAMIFAILISYIIITLLLKFKRSINPN
ncbi:HAAS signaling domain-containing protein [Christiangramia sp. LLG6405-1]|uniref:HAAS signaling domain-containing protein n=1 Tax=Christiangramia sp. LLG6405-1 TaxID=3160832 RepID=UPI00386FB5DF